jgi:4-hydroxy-4-methyl-2-oxoglutarate aldolase
MDRIIQDVRRAPKEMIEAYAALPAATVYESNEQSGAMNHTIKPIVWGQRMCGSALTVRCFPADNLMLHAAIAIAQPGDVIVADVGELLDAGYWGEITTVAAMARGVAGLVIAGGARDHEVIVRRGFPVWSSAICMRATVKKNIGWINHLVSVGGVTVRPGDLVLGDDDGVVVVAQDRLAAVLERACAKEASEAEVMRRLEQGELTLDVLGFRKALTDHGITL